MLSAALCKLLAEHDEVFHDQRIQARISHGFYQADVLQQCRDGSYFGEAKDYSRQNTPVGRPDLTALGGKLNDLPIKGAIFFSATGYTGPAKDYAAASNDIVGKQITLINAKIAVEQDEQGRLKEIRVRFHLPRLIADRAKFEPIFTEVGLEQLMEIAIRKWSNPEQQSASLEVQIPVDALFDASGTQIVSVWTVLFDHPPQEYGERHYATILISGLFIRVENELVGIRGVTADIPVLTLKKTLVLTARGRARLLVQDEQGDIDRLVTDLDLRRVTFRDDGRIELADSEGAFKVEDIDSEGPR